MAPSSPNYRRATLLSLIALALVTLNCGIANEEPPRGGLHEQRRPSVMGSLDQVQAMFIENVGQYDSRVRYQLHSAAGTLWLADDALWLTILDDQAPNTSPDPSVYDPHPSASAGETRRLKATNIRLSFVGANSSAHLEPFEQLETRVSYLLGNNPEYWRSDVPVWRGVRYVDLYPGVDLELTAGQGNWTWRLTSLSDITDGSNDAALNEIRLRVEGVAALEFEREHIWLRTEDRAWRLPSLGGVTVANHPNHIHHVEPKIWNLALSRTPTSVLTSPQLQSVSSDLQYGVVLRGSAVESVSSVVVDSTGSAYIAGSTTSIDFPATIGAFSSTYAGGFNDAFIAKVSPNGSTLIYVTYLGGNDQDSIFGIDVDSTGSVFIVGITGSNNFPTTANSFDQIGHSMSSDTFISRLDSSGSSLIYSTYIAGSSQDMAMAVKADSSGSAYVCGRTASQDFPVTSGSFGQAYNGGLLDAFVLKVNPSGSQLMYSTFVGGSANEECLGIDIDQDGSIYAVGNTGSHEFPVSQDAIVNQLLNSQKAFILKLNSVGSSLLYSTYLGGSGIDSALEPG
jgi:hypothetical protein